MGSCGRADAREKAYLSFTELRSCDHATAHPVHLLAVSGIVGGTVKVKDEITIDFDIAIAERLAAASGQEFREGRWFTKFPVTERF